MSAPGHERARASARKRPPIARVALLTKSFAPSTSSARAVLDQFTMNTAGGVLECTAFVPLPGQGPTEYECLVDGPPLPCGTDAADMPSPGPDSE